MKLTKKLNLKLPSKKTPKKNRMVVLHKRQITAICLLILIGVAGYLNWSFQQDAIDPEVAAVYNEASKKLGEAKMVSSTPDNMTETATASKTDDYFTQAKLERDVKRSESMDMLTEILETQGTDKAARTRAEDQIHLLSDFTEKEAMIENLIRAKGYEEAVAFMGENLISIAVKTKGLNEVDAAILQDIVVSATAYSVDKIKILEIQ